MNSSAEGRWTPKLAAWPRSTAALAFAASLAAGSAHAADAALIEAAKKEGEVTWYSTQIISQLVRPMSAAFEKKYPGIKVRAIRAGNAELAIKMLNESRAGRVQVDIFDGTTTFLPLKREGHVLRWLPDSAKDYPADLKDPEGYWITNNLYIITPGFNTSLVPRGTEPKTYHDLLDPKWRGKLAWNGFPASSGVGGFVGTVLTEMGKEKGLAFLREFSKQNVANMRSSAREVLDQVIAGEYAIGLQIFNHHTVISAKKGAPVDWIKMEPATGTLAVLSIHKSAPHPNAAKLLADFIVSKEGQVVFREADYIPAHPDVAASVPTLKPKEGNFRIHFFTPEQTEDNMPEWKKVSDEFFR
jgi:iron(III) transport system substrate-binding protein